MANPEDEVPVSDGASPRVRLSSFCIEGLFGGPPIQIEFPARSGGQTGPSIVIISGRNGTGKTTVLRMISGLLKLDFDEFRKMPFTSATLTTSNGDKIGAERVHDPEFPIIMRYNKETVPLSKNKGYTYTEAHRARIDELRAMAGPAIGNIQFQLLELDRLPLNDRLTEHEKSILKAYGAQLRAPQKSLADRVVEFLRDAQINYRRFFRGGELSFPRRILDRLDPDVSPATVIDLRSRLEAIRNTQSNMKRFGLHLDEPQLRLLERLLESDKYNLPQQLAVLETYVEVQEDLQNARDLVATRLNNFEQIMKDFLVGKSVEVEARRGLLIKTTNGPITEQQLSSGEYHFLCMMVAALLCQREGTIIAIDEPELSLHVSWQRRLVSALSSCASGSSPTFLFATHSLAIASEHSDCVYSIAPVDD